MRKDIPFVRLFLGRRNFQSIGDKLGVFAHVLKITRADFGDSRFGRVHGLLGGGLLTFEELFASLDISAFDSLLV